MAKHWDSFLSYCMSAPVQPANSRTTTDMLTPNTNKLCITLVVDYSNGRMTPSNTFLRSSVNQMCTKVWPLFKYKLWSLHTLGCLTKLSLLKRLLHCEEGEHDKVETILHRKNKGKVQTVLFPNPKVLEQWLNIGPMKCKELLTWIWAQEEKEPMSQYLPGQEMKIKRLMYSPQARNSLTSSSKTKCSTSRSWGITCSVQGDYQSFQTPNGSKYCREGSWPWCYHLQNPPHCHWQPSNRDVWRLQILLWTFKTYQNCQEPQGLAYHI